MITETAETEAGGTPDPEAILVTWERRQLWSHLVGPLLSLGLHVVMLVALGNLLTGSRSSRPAHEVEVTVRELVLRELQPQMVQDLPKDDIVTEIPVPTLEPPAISEDPMETPGAQEPGEQLQTIGSAEDGATETGFDEVTGPLEAGDLVAMVSPVRLPAAYAARASQESRARGRRDFGGSEKTEKAVLKALRWLKDHQKEDGAWSQTKPKAMTALGLLAFMAHGESTSSAEFGVPVRKSSQYLYETMMAIPEDNPPLGDYWPYENGMMTYALAESFGIGQVPLIKGAMEKGLRFIVKGQQPGGGWDYQYCQGARWDLTATAWQIQALKAGYVAGAETPGLPEAMEKGARFLKDVAWKDGSFQWVPLYPGDWGVQGCGALCLQLTGYGRSREARNVIENVFEHGMAQFKAVEENLYWERDNPYYDWYYETQVMFHAGRTTWKRWNSGFSELLVSTQHEDGHWEIPGEGSQRVEYDPYQTTALNCLSLQIYYRYLPSYQEPATIVRQKSDILKELRDSAMLHLQGGLQP